MGEGVRDDDEEWDDNQIGMTTYIYSLLLLTTSHYQPR